MHGNDESSIRVETFFVVRAAMKKCGFGGQFGCLPSSA